MPCDFSFDVCGAFGKWKIILVGGHFFKFKSALDFLVMPLGITKVKNKILNRSLHLMRPSTMGPSMLGSTLHELLF